MKTKMNTLRKLLVTVMALLTMASCNTITEELPLCQNYVRFTYTRNMKFADAFSVEVKSVDLFVFDENDRFVTCLSSTSPFVANGQMELQLAPGRYHLIAWAGLNENSYVFNKDLVAGVSTPKDITVKMKREYPTGNKGEAVMARELDALWHSETTVEISEAESKTTVMDLTKDTNKLRLVIQADYDTPLEADELDFRVTGANGFLNYDNSLLPDESIIYSPYYLSDATVSGQDGEGGVNAVIAELNTLRLMADKKSPMRLLVTRKKDGQKIVDVDLVEYLLLTKMEGHQMPAQEYLDRQDEYAMVFLLNGNYMVVQIKINDWVIRIQEGDL